MSDTNDKMQELNQRRKEHGENEMELLRSNFWKRKQIEDQKRFERQTATESLLDIQYQSDNMMILELLSKWHGNAKNDNQKTMLMSTIKSLMRMSSYVTTLQTVSKSAVSNMLDEQRMHNRAIKKIHDLEHENMALKAEIQHYIDEQEEQQ